MNTNKLLHHFTSLLSISHFANNLADSDCTLPIELVPDCTFPIDLVATSTTTGSCQAY